MSKYEVLYILKPDMEEETVDSAVEKFKGIVEQNQGEVSNLDKWGKRKLAYEIDDYKEGIYILMHFQSPYQAAQELDRRFKLSDEALRHMIIREDD